LYGVVFLLAESWKHLLDSLLKPDGLTAKQWMMLVAIEALGPEAPTLGQAAGFYGSSHQAAKKLALRLQGQGFLEIVPDPNDRRSLRLHLTPHHYEYWGSRAAAHQTRFSKLFEGVETADLRRTTDVLQTMLDRANATMQAREPRHATEG